MKADERAAALVALVESDLASRSRDVVEPAARKAREELAQARRAARARVATAVAEERAAFAARIGAAEAQLATARRMVRQRRLKALIAEGWERLPKALAARWSDAAGRRAWIDATLDCARAVLPAAPWQVHGPPSWSEVERTQAATRLAAQGIEATCDVAADIDAGLRVTSRNVEVDATLVGLLADRAAVEGRLLHWHEQQREDP
jgi:hypothetical protein